MTGVNDSDIKGSLTNMNMRAMKKKRNHTNRMLAQSKMREQINQKNFSQELYVYSELRKTQNAYTENYGKIIYIRGSSDVPNDFSNVSSGDVDNVESIIMPTGNPGQDKNILYALKQKRKQEDKKYD